jgi:sulfhydrogenase subunit beta (sulfur reductase)
MDRALLERKSFGPLIASIRSRAVLYAPSGDGGALPSFRPISSEAEINLKQPNTRLSVKGVFFPQRETLMSFDGSVLLDASTGANGAGGARCSDGPLCAPPGAGSILAAGVACCLNGSLSELPGAGGDAGLSRRPTGENVAAPGAAGALGAAPGEGDAPSMDRGKGTVVFGARPCDVRSLTWLDRIFGGEAPGPGAAVHQDPYYMERRRNALIVSLACDAPCESCFCTSVGGSPYGTEGADILASLTERSEDAPLLLEALTAKGRDFLEAHASLLSPAGDGDVRAREKRAKAASAKMTVLDFSGVKEKADASFESPLWDTMTGSCLGCGVCTYLCPTCHCFDITDETRGTKGVRIRSWDSCQFPLFTLHASGHNPRPSKKARMRQRIMHKYSYAVETAGAVFCSGCGRCVRYCPVNLDIRRMLAALKETP